MAKLGEMGGYVGGDVWLNFWRWVAKLVRDEWLSWGRWVAKLVGRRVAKLVERWVAKLVARLLTTAALWVRSQTYLQNTKWAT